MNTKQIGEISEAFIVAELLRLGYSVSRPVGDNQRYDMLLDVDGKFYRIQCKTAVLEENGSVSFPTCSTYAHRGGKRKTYVGSAEFIIAYCHETGKVYFEPVSDDTPATKRTLRTTPTKNANNYLLAEDRELQHIPV